jgi:hypothetical protein
MKIHHTTESDYGTCRICNKPIRMLWFNKEETCGQSERAVEDRKGNAHHACVNGKSLKQLNEERKKLYARS